MKIPAMFAPLLYSTRCENVDMPVKRIIDEKFCFKVTQTICTESISEIPNQVCSYSYNTKSKDSIAKTLDVTFEKQRHVQLVTVCSYHLLHGYGPSCKEVAQETAYNVPVVVPMDVPVKISYPDPIKTCINQPIALPVVNCKDEVEEKCIVVPKLMNDVESVEKCQTYLKAKPSCQDLSLTLPKLICVELVYGYVQQ